MSEFKFSCANCGQHLIVDENWAGRHINCPGCQADLVIPDAGEVSAARSAVTPDPQGRTPPVCRTAPPLNLRRPTRGALCGLAVASLVLTLLTVPVNFATLVTRLPVGLLFCVPGLICGHIALRKIRGTPGLAGRGFALTGIIGGYVFAPILLVGAWAALTVSNFEETVLASLNQESPSPARPPILGSRPLPAPVPPGPLGQPRVSPRPSGPPSLPLRRPSFPPPGSSSSPRPAIPPPPAYSPALPRSDPKVTTNPRTVVIPTAAVSGRLGGQYFSISGATLQGDILKLVQGTGMVPDFEVAIFLFGQAGPGTILLVPNQSTSASTPHVHLRWKDPTGPKMSSLAQDYVMRLELGPASGSSIPGRIYLELPQSYQTRLAGAFLAQVVQ